MEVPSGALADIFGRRKLLILTGSLMMMEIAILCFTPKGNPTLLFSLFLVNRILSGIAEAAASGADEALAYDSLKMEGDTKDWGKVLEIQMRFQSIAFIIAMILGAAVYDPELMQRTANAIGFHFTLNQDITLKFPLYLTLIMSALTLMTALQMKDPDTSETCVDDTLGICTVSVRQAFSLTFQAGRWILQTPFALLIILFGLLFDGIIRMVITLSSQYYRMIHLPEASFGIIGAMIAGLGMFIPRLARNMTKNHTSTFNFAVVTGLTLSGLVGMIFFLPYIGLIPAIILFSGMFMTTFFVSHYLNEITPSHNRATVLSFKGLSFNLSYGLFGIFYSLLLRWMRLRTVADVNTTGMPKVEDHIFMESFSWFPVVFILLLAITWIYSVKKLKQPGN